MFRGQKCELLVGWGKKYFDLLRRKGVGENIFIFVIINALLYFKMFALWKIMYDIPWFGRYFCGIRSKNTWMWIRIKKIWVHFASLSTTLINNSISERCTRGGWLTPASTAGTSSGRRRSSSSTLSGKQTLEHFWGLSAHITYFRLQMKNELTKNTNPWPSAVALVDFWRFLDF